MKFGVTMFPNNLEEVATGARLAEEMGFEYVGIADSQSLARELYITLSVVAMSTQRVLLGPTVSNPLTRHPAVVASAVASLNELSKGRAFLGIGTGDSAVLNLGLRPARLAELHHYIQSVREMLAGDSAEYRGDRAHVRWSASTTLSTGVPIAMSAEGPRTLAMAGSIADAAIIHTGLTTDVLQDTVARIREGERAAGREPGSAKVWAFAKCNIADDRDEAIEEIKMALAASGHHAFRFTLEGKNVPEEYREAVSVLHREYEAAEHEQVGETRNATLTDELGLTDYFAERFAVVGTPEECRAKVRDIFESGVDVLLITAIGPSPQTIVRRFGEEVIAPLQAGAAVNLP